MTDLTVVDENYKVEKKKGTVKEVLEFVIEHDPSAETSKDMVLLLRGEDDQMVLYTTLDTPHLNLAIDNLKLNVLGL